MYGARDEDFTIDSSTVRSGELSLIFLLVAERIKLSVLDGRYLILAK